MTTTQLIELLKKHERGGATGRPREVMFEVDDRIIDTDGIEVTGSGDGLISELYLSLPSAQPEISRIEQELHGKTPEEQYEFLYWLLLKYGLAYTDSRLAVIEWLRGEPSS